jgi:hypothetical protein
MATTPRKKVSKQKSPVEEVEEKKSRESFKNYSSG